MIIWSISFSHSFATALDETPHFILTWNLIGTDLDLYVFDPNRDEIYYLHPEFSR
jgi:uncharacterized protein YfaP (DUF2135 family)